MPRKGPAPRRPLVVDPVYSSPLVTQLVNKILLSGKRSLAEHIVYGALEGARDKTGTDPVVTLKRALDNVKPAIEVKSRRVGGATYQVPVEVRPERRVALGTRFSEEPTCHWAVEIPRALVQVDLDPARIGRNYPVAEGIVADVGRFCDALLEAGVTAGARDGAAAARAALAGRQSEVAAHGFAAELELMHQLDAALPDDALVIADMTIQSYWGVLYLDARRPGGFAYPMSGALGSGLPTALGAVAANPDAPVVVLAGDGGFLMGGHELATAQQNGLHFVTLLVNDSCFGVLKNYQMSAYGHSSSVDLRSPDFEQLAAGYGVGYRRIEDTSRAGDALREAIAGLDGGCRLIELQAELAAPPQSI